MAASSTAVTVLAPNGRRQTVKISHSTPLLQVLDDVCKKQGFCPDDYDLKFQRTVLDLSQQWRFASLPNNAKLEMVPSTRQRSGAESRVRIALHLEDGSRVQDSFSSAQTLWELINHFPQTRVLEPQLCEATPLCIYMRDEVAGVEPLKQTTLKSLGLTGGSAIVRYVLKKTRSPGDGVSMETAAGATEEIPESPQTSSECGPTPEPHPEPLASVAPPPQSPAPSGPCPVREEGDGDLEPQQTVRPKTRPVRSQQEEEEERPGPSGTRPSQDTPPGPSRTRPSQDTPPGPSRTRPTQATPPNFVPFSGGGQRLGGHLGPGLGIKGEASPNYSSLPGGPVGPPEAKKHKPSSDAKRADAARPAERTAGHGEEFLEPLEREPLLYHMDAVAHRRDNREDLPDEFFEVTVDDIRKRFAQLKSERKLLEEAPLMTKALRESRMREKIERYPKVVVRIQFPDRHVLQGFFRPLETVGALKQYVRSHLADPHQSFYLFIAPPKSTLDDPTVTLFQANLFPAALIYFGSDVQTDSYLQRQLLESSVSALQADEAIADCMPRSPTSSSASLVPEDSFPPPVDSHEPANQQGLEEPPPPPQPDSQAAPPVRTDSSKVPKWLKLPGKK
ncbi:tether containing UBX domain for GLUT4 [Anguilla rostrata]|uniref:tether containing UBX domain for GLUT4 n=1 Tax=Anguilla rostrata TaxID=7938 RepID=UPI0030CFF7F2